MNHKSAKNNFRKLAANSSPLTEQAPAAQIPAVNKQLQSVSLYLPELSAAIDHHDIYRFRDLSPKLKSLLEAVDLTDLAKRLQRLHDKCITAQDLVLNEIEMQKLIKDMDCSKPHADAPFVKHK